VIRDGEGGVGDGEDAVAHVALRAWSRKSLPPDLIRGWIPVFGKDHAPLKSQSVMTIRRKVIML